MFIYKIACVYTGIFYCFSWIQMSLKLVESINECSDLAVDVCDQFLNLALRVQQLYSLSVGVIPHSKRPWDGGSKITRKGTIKQRRRKRLFPLTSSSALHSQSCLLRSRLAGALWLGISAAQSSQGQKISVQVFLANIGESWTREMLILPTWETPLQLSKRRQQTSSISLELPILPGHPKLYSEPVTLNTMVRKGGITDKNWPWQASQYIHQKHQGRPNQSLG